jgi:hypothetical protein
VGEATRGVAVLSRINFKPLNEGLQEEDEQQRRERVTLHRAAGDGDGVCEASGNRDTRTCTSIQLSDYFDGVLRQPHFRHNIGELRMANAPEGVGKVNIRDVQVFFEVASVLDDGGHVEELL